GFSPVSRWMATAASRSQLDPGKTMTAAVICPSPRDRHARPCAWHLPPPRPRHEMAGTGSAMTTRLIRPTPSSFEVDAIGLDHLVGQQLLAHFDNLAPGRFRVAARKLQLDQLALARAFDLREAQAVQRMRDGLPLRVE